MKNVFQIKADIKGSKMATSPFITQNDAISFEVSLYDGDKEIDLSSVTTSTLASTRGDKTTVVVEGEKTGPNKITFDIGTTETKLTGEVNAVVQLYGADGRVSTVRFIYKVTSDPVGAGFIPSEREKTLIEVVLGDGPLAIKAATEAATYAQEQGDYVEERKPILEEAIGLAEQILDESFETGALDTNIKQRLTSLETQYTPKLTSLESSLAEKANQSQVALFERIKDAAIKTKLPFPIGFTWTDAPINIYKSITGEITTDFDVSIYEGTGVTYHVSPTKGSNTTGDGSEGKPFKSAWKAVEQPDVKVIILESGYYPRSDTVYTHNINKNLTIKTKDENKATLSISDNNYAWTLSAGTNKVYQTARSAVGVIIDKTNVDEYGDAIPLAKKSSIAEVDATPGSWYTNGVNAYVHTHNSRIPDNDVRLILNLQNVNITGGAGKIYFENIIFEGGKEPIRSEGLSNPRDTEIYLKNCEFKYSTDSNGARLWGIGKVFLQGCKAAYSRFDGFNYHVQNGVVPDVIEVDCQGRFNGLTEPDNSHNGSTMHDGGRIIRVNGDYHHNKGPNVIDVNEGAQSWCCGVLAHESVATPGTVSNTDFKNGNVGASKMWLESCVSYGSDYSLVTAGDGANSVSHLRNNLMLSGKQADAGTIIKDY